MLARELEVQRLASENAGMRASLEAVLASTAAAHASLQSKCAF